MARLPASPHMSLTSGPVATVPRAVWTGHGIVGSKSCSRGWRIACVEIITTTADEIEVRLSRSEARMINNALNEVANGIHFSDSDLLTRTGFSRDETRALLAAVARALGRPRPR